MVIKAGNIIIGDQKVDVAKTTSTPPAISEPAVAPVVKQPIVREARVVGEDTSGTSNKISQYVDDMGAGNKINSLFD